MRRRRGSGNHEASWRTDLTFYARVDRAQRESMTSRGRGEPCPLAGRPVTDDEGALDWSASEAAKIWPFWGHMWNRRRMRQPEEEKMRRRGVERRPKNRKNSTAT